MSETADLNQELLRAVLQTAVDGIIVIDQEGIVKLFNPAAEKIFGYQNSEILGQSVNSLMPEPYQSEHDGYLHNYKRTGDAKIIGIGREVVGRRKDGEVFPIYLAVNEMSVSGRTMYAGIVRDISEKKIAEKKLEQANKELERSNMELEQFAYVASHDLQEPLRMITSFAQLLENRYKDQIGEDGLEFIDFIVSGADRMKVLIHDLLTYSRLNSRAKPFQTVECSAALADVILDLKLFIQENHAQVNFYSLPAVKADPVQMRQLFHNLIKNGVKFHRDEPPVVNVTAKSNGSDWVFSVQDNGIGIETKYFERIFTIFQRLHSRGEYTGNGIGLALCKKIVERHGGKIWVESLPGKGSKFLFTIPKG